MLTAFLAGLHVSDPLTAGNLTLFPLLSTNRGKYDFLTLSPDFPAELMVISEVSEAGSVPELLLENRAELPLLVIDGQELAGAKQNRMVNLSILAKPGVPIRIPVSCVEQGRWSYKSREFAPAARTAFAELRRTKMEHVSRSMASSGHRTSSQGEVWDRIAEKADRMRAFSDTGAMEEIFEQKKHRIDEAAVRLRMPEKAIGAVFAIGSKIVGLDLVTTSESWQKIFSTVLSGYVVDAIDNEAHDQERPPSIHDAEEFILRRIAMADCRSYPAVGEGTDLRLTGHGVQGAALLVDDEIIHLCAFST